MDKRTPKEIRMEKRKRKTIAFLELTKSNGEDQKMTDQTLMNVKRIKVDEEVCSPSGSEVADVASEERLIHKKPKDEDITDAFKGKKLSEADATELRKLLKERWKAIQKFPLLRLKSPVGEKAQLNITPRERVPLFLSDIQHFILYCLLVRGSPYCPRWCVMERAVNLSSLNILFIENSGLSDLLLSKSQLHALSETNFPFQLELLMPSAYSGHLVQEFCGVPLSYQQCHKAIYQYGSLDAAEKNGEVFRVLRAIFPVKHESDKNESRNMDSSDSRESSHSHCMENNVSLPASDKFPRTQLLLSVWQMLEEGYPVPINGESRERYQDFVPTKHLYKEVTNHSPMYGVDCEMCITTTKASELTRVSIVNEKLETILDTLVMPYNNIKDYLTEYSGITQAMMEGVTTRLEDVQKFIQENIEPDAILVGQSLNFDLKALKMFHPYVIDTSIIFNMTGDRHRKTKLRHLTQTFLKEEIQVQDNGHCSIEDSSAALRLVQLKLSNSIDFGDIVLQSFKKGQESNLISNLKTETQNRKNFARSLFSYISSTSLNSHIVGMPEAIEEYVDFLNPKSTMYVQDDGLGLCKAISENNMKSPSGGTVTCAIVPNINHVANVMKKMMLENKLSIGHIKLSEEESAQLSAGSSDIINRLNHWVEEIHSAVPLNGVFMVVLCGREKSSNGTCCISLKKKKIERVKQNLSENVTSSP